MTTYTYNSTDTPVALKLPSSDVFLFARGSTITVPDHVTVSSVRVTLTIDRSGSANNWDADLVIQVNRGGALFADYTVNGSLHWDPAPEDAHHIFVGGVSVALVAYEGYDGQSFTATKFDDAAPTNIRGQIGFAGNTYAPEGLLHSPPAALADYAGADAFGEWHLGVVDAYGGLAGSLVSWSLEIDVEDAPPDPPEPPICEVGNYAVQTNSVHATFSGLACGQTLTAGSLTKNNAVATLDNIDTDCRRT